MKIRQKLAVALLTLSLIPAVSLPAWAETVLEKVSRTGVLTAGTRKDAMPLAYVNEQQEWLGYSIEMLVLIRDRLEERLNREIALELVEVNPSNRIPKILSGEVDIVCGASSFTWNRESYIDFSLSYFANGTQILVTEGNNFDSPESLAGKKIGVIDKTINQEVMRVVQPDINLVTFVDSQQALAALKQGEIDGFAWDGFLLEGLRLQSEIGDSLAITPQTPYAIEGIACMLPEDDSSFRDLVNYTLVEFMQGYLQGDSRYVAIFDRWFGEKGVIPIERELVVDFFQNTIDAREQIPLDKTVVEE